MLKVSAIFATSLRLHTAMIGRSWAYEVWWRGVGWGGDYDRTSTMAEAGLQLGPDGEGANYFVIVGAPQGAPSRQCHRGEPGGGLPCVFFTR
jgi:hypothetical protein